MGETPLLILYGSQTGNSREVSKELCEKAVAKGYAARVVSMADFKTLDFEAERRVVVVCSSTGNGDAPDNADRFYRYVKRKTTPAILAKSHFAVCAMGDQNYELFCEVGKQFDQHFERLGGTRFLKRCDVDEVEGIEETVHKWYEALWPALAAVPAADGADVEMAEAAAPAAAGLEEWEGVPVPAIVAQACRTPWRGKPGLGPRAHAVLDYFNEKRSSSRPRGRVRSRPCAPRT